MNETEDRIYQQATTTVRVLAAKRLEYDRMMSGWSASRLKTQGALIAFVFLTALYFIDWLRTR